MKVYVAGPMRGRPAFNFPAFHEAEKRLVEAGHEVFNPAAYDESNGFSSTGLTGRENLEALGFSLRDALLADLTWICQSAEAIALLPDWYASSGARAEVALAHALGIRVADVEVLVKEGAA